MDEVLEDLGLRDRVPRGVEAEDLLAGLDEESPRPEPEQDARRAIDGRLFDQVARVLDAPPREKLPRAGAGGSAVLVVEDGRALDDHRHVPVM